MIIAWMSYATLCAAAAAACAGCVERMLEGRRHARRVVWTLALGASVLVPAALSWIARAPVAQRLGDGASLAVASHDSMDLDAIAVTLWAVCSLVVATCLVASHIRLRRMLRTLTRVQIGGEQVVVSLDFGPAVVGVARPEIVLPSWALTLDDADRRLVLAHEREHIRGGDPWVQRASLAIVVVMPWNPALWWQLIRLRLAIEMDCDARVVARQHVHPARYGELLVRALASAPAFTSLALVQSTSTLARRIDALLGVSHRSAARMVVSSTTGIALASLVAIAPAPPLRRAMLPSPAPVTVGAATVATAAITPARVAPSSPSTQTAKARARRRVVAPTSIPPVQVIPSVAPSADDVPRATAAPLPARRNGGVFGRAVLVPRGDSTTPRPATGGAAAGGVFRAVGRPPHP